MEKSNIPTPDIMKVLEVVDELQEQIKDKESEALQRVFLRFCLMHGKEINYDHVRVKKSATRPNEATYYYKPGTPDEFKLLTRDLEVHLNGDGAPEYKLNIFFNPILLSE